MVPDVAIAKAMALKLSNNNNVIFDVFGHLVYKDPSSEPLSTMTV